MLSKLTWTRALVGLWLVATTSYFLYDAWQHFAEHQLAEAYKSGRDDVLNQVAKRAETCSPFDIRGSESSVQLISVTCLEPERLNQPEATAALPPSGAVTTRVIDGRIVKHEVVYPNTAQASGP